MAHYHVLYNPLAGNGRGQSDVKKLADMLAGHELSFYDITQTETKSDFFTDIPSSEHLLVAGGDGTLSRFANTVAELDLPHEIYFFGCGSGNDFLHDVGRKRGCEPFCINQYLRNLPVILIDGKPHRFINGAGAGIDGYCCAEVNRRHTETGKNISYKRVAAQGLLYGYRPGDLTVTVDGKSYRFDQVWMAPAMQGRYFGGGVKAAPTQDRLGEEGTVSLMVMRCKSRARALTLLPSVISGNHLRFTENVTVLTGHRFDVTFDRVVDMQIDGENQPRLQNYQICTAKAYAEDLTKKTAHVGV